VTKEAALRAAAWCEYLDANARRYYGLLKDDELRAAQALAIKLERGALEDGFTLRDVRRNQWRSLTRMRPGWTGSKIGCAARPPGAPVREGAAWRSSTAAASSPAGTAINSAAPVPTRMRVDARQGGLTGFGRSWGGSQAS